MITGTVVHGKRIGRTLNFPTANLRIDAGAVMPARGVYAAYAWTGSARHRAIMNIGEHPTLPEGAPTVEVHLLDYDGDLYGQTLRVEPVQRLRSETTFASTAELARQLKKDAQAARHLLDP